MSDVLHESLDIPGYWKIIGFRKLSNIPSTADRTLYITTHLRPLIINRHYDIYDGKVDKAGLKVAYVPIAEIVRLHIGAIFHNGINIPLLSESHAFRNETAFTETLDLSQSNLRVFDRYQEIDGTPLIATAYNTEDVERENNNLVVCIGVKGNPYKYIIPCFEIFRFFYATSSVLVKTFLSDEFLDPTKNIWNPSESNHDKATNAAKLRLRQKMLDSDAKFIARFFCDKYALDMAKNIFLYAAATKETQGVSFERMIYALPPVNKTIQIKFIGKQTAAGSVYVRRIITANERPNFSSLEWSRDNDGTPGEGEPTDNPSNRQDNTNRNEEANQILSTNQSSYGVKPTRISESEINDRLPYFNEIPAEKKYLENRPGSSWKSPNLKEPEKGTVVDGSSKFGFIGKATIDSSEKRKTPGSVKSDAINQNDEGQDYDDIFKHLLRIRRLPSVEVTFLQVAEEVLRYNGEEFNVYPKALDGKQISWLYIDPDKKVRRFAMIAKITTNEATRYILELQQKKAGENSTLVFWSIRGSPVPLGAIERLFIGCAKAKSARLDEARMYGLDWNRLKHTTQSKTLSDSQHFLERIFKAEPLDLKT